MWEPGYATQTGCGEFRVRSQTDPDKSHMVREAASGLVCECSDHAYRKADYKYIKVVLEIAMKNKGYRNSGFRIMELSKLNLCNNYAKKARWDWRHDPGRGRPRQSRWSEQVDDAHTERRTA